MASGEEADSDGGGVRGMAQGVDYEIIEHGFEQRGVGLYPGHIPGVTVKADFAVTLQEGVEGSRLAMK